MVSRRRSSNKNLGNNIAEVHRRLRYLERRPAKTKLGNRIVNAAAITPNTITEDQVSFGATIITDETDLTLATDNPKDGLIVINPDTGTSAVYDGNYDNWIYISEGEGAKETSNAAQEKAITALANAATAYSSAIGSLQPSASTIVNASNQITAINGTGITVYSGASATTGARVVLNSLGLAGFTSASTGSDNGASFSISASTGIATFAGNITTGATITGGTMNIGGNAIIDASGFLTATGATVTGTINATGGTFTGTVSGGTFVGGIFRTAAVGSTRVEINSTTSVDIIKFYVGAGADPVGQIGVQSNGVALIGPASNVLGLTPNGGAALTTTQHQLTFSSNGGATLGAALNSIVFSNSSTSVALGSSSPAVSLALRNIQALTVGTATSQGVSSDGAVSAGYGWTVGDIVLTY